MVARTLNRTDRASLRMARNMGVALSSEELDDLMDETGDEASNDTSGKGGLRADTARALRGLLRALGCLVVKEEGDDLLTMAARKIAELRGGQCGGANNNQQPTGNALIDGMNSDLLPQQNQEQQPMYMSLNEISKIPDPTAQGLALSLAIGVENHQRQRQNDALDAGRRREAKIAESRGRRQVRINSILARYPQARHEVDRALNQPASMAFSVDGNGNVQDPCVSVLETLERALAQRFPDQAA